MAQRAAQPKQAAPLPGIFATIAAAVSALLVQPLPLALPLAVDLYLWAGARLSPAAVAEPLRRWLAAQDQGVNQDQAADAVAWLADLARGGDLVAIVGWFVPSLLVGLDRAGLAAPWPRPSLDPGGAPPTLLVGLGLFLVGVWAAMAFASMLARVVRGGNPGGNRLLRASGLAAARYLGFLALVVAAVLAIGVPAAVLGAVLTVVGLDVLLGLMAAVLVPLGLLAAICLAFVGDAIVVAEVGPLRAIQLSFGVVRRNPWPSVGLLVVLTVASAGVADLAANFGGTAPGLLLAVVLYAFVGTGLALARMQFFHDRLRRWRADLIPPLPTP